MEKTLNPYLITAALECAQQNPSGFTIKWDMTEQPESGYVVAVPSGTSKGTCGFLRSLALAIEKQLWFGGWKDTKTGEWYWDCVEVLPIGQLEKAMQLGRERGELAIYDLANGCDIRLD